MIHTFDQQMKKAYKELNYNKTMWRTRFGSHSFCILVIILAIFQYGIDVASFPLTNVSYYNMNGVITYCTPFLVSNIMILQFSSLIIVLQQRFGWINEELERLQKRSSNIWCVLDFRGVTRNRSLQ